MKGMIISITVTLILALTSACAYSSVYKCNVDGVPVYSGVPCGDGEQEISKQYVTPKKARSGQNRLTSGSETLDDIQRYTELKRLERNIFKTERKIRAYRNQMSREIARIKRNAKRAANNLAGATWQGSLATQMSATTSKYQSFIDIEHHKLTDLVSQKQQLQDEIKEQAEIKEQTEAKKEEKELNQKIKSDHEDAEEITDYIQDRKIKRELTKIDNRIIKLKKDMDREINAIKNKSRHANNNLAGATWEQSLSTEMEAVVARYESQIQIEQEKRKRLLQY